MTKDEKKHFILKQLNSNTGSSDSSTLTLCVNPPLTVSEVNELCRDMEHEVPLRLSSDKNNPDKLGVLKTQVATDAFNTAKYLHLNSIDNVEFEVLNFLYNKSLTTQTRINHILVSSTKSVVDTLSELSIMRDNDLIYMNETPLSFMYDSNNKRIDNHVQAFENIHKPIKASITTQGKTYFKQQYMNNDKPQQTFNGPTNYIAGDNYGKQTLLTNETNNDHKQDKKTLSAKIWYLISENKLIAGLILIAVPIIIGSTSIKTCNPNTTKDNSSKPDTIAIKR